MLLECGLVGDERRSALTRGASSPQQILELGAPTTVRDMQEMLQAAACGRPAW
jgi:hypothetical protein